ncbi:MAG: peptidoglycan-binding protein [Minisyncoccia bacterium]
MKFYFKKNLFLLFTFLFLIFPLFSFADNFGQTKSFFVNSDYDLKNRLKVDAILEKFSNNAYFYLEKDWFYSLPDNQKNEVLNNLDFLSREFDNNIYPKLTSFYGKEWDPGIDNDSRITVLFQQMKEEAGGYFNSGDEYLTLQNPNSNQREIVYLNTKSLFSKRLPSYLAHEFTHLITFYQKEKLRNVEEDVWLNELRAEYAPTYLGYDQNYPNSNLQQRISDFLSNPSVSLTFWENKRQNYGIINLFAQYLAEKYGQKVIKDTMQSSKVGIASIEESLKNNGFSVDFSDVFKNFLIAIFSNDCDNLGSDLFCFKNENLKSIKVLPFLILLPRSENSEYSLNYFTKSWTGNWYKIAGSGNFQINFEGKREGGFQVVYIFCSQNKCKVDNILLDNLQKGIISFSNLSPSDSLSLIVFFENKVKTQDYNVYDFSIKIKNQNENEALLEELLQRVKDLQNQILQIQIKISEILRQKISCANFSGPILPGEKSQRVKCLQEFLKLQGKDIYPEGIISGYYGNLTKAAVKRFQERYKEDILLPRNLLFGTGIADNLTIQKINFILNFGKNQGG